QMYGGIRAERTETNLAVGSTAGQVLVWRDRIITAYYFSTSGGRTSSVHDAWPRMAQVPYLVSVADPYDYLSPHHVWPTRALTPAQVAGALHVSEVRDLRVLRNSSGRARAVLVLGAHGWRRVGGAAVRSAFHLGSTDFQIAALDDPPAAVLYASRVQLHGFLRGLGRARLQLLTDQGWQTIRHVRPSADGRFALTVRAVRSTRFRLAYNGVAGTPVQLGVAPRVDLRAEGPKLRVSVSPRLPLQVQRLTAKRWRPVARSNGVFDRNLRPGSYRVAVLGGPGYVAAVTHPVSVRRPAA